MNCEMETIDVSCRLAYKSFFTLHVIEKALKFVVKIFDEKKIVIGFKAIEVSYDFQLFNPFIKTSMRRNFEFLKTFK